MKFTVTLLILVCAVTLIVAVPRPEETEDTEGDADNDDSVPDTEDGEEQGDAVSEGGMDDHLEDSVTDSDGDMGSSDSAPVSEKQAEEAPGGADQAASGSEKPDRQNTYYKVLGIVQKATEHKDEDDYFAAFVDYKLQQYIRVPIIAAIGAIDYFSKIESCFGDIEQNVQKVVQEQNAQYKQCKEKQERDCGSTVSDKSDGELNGIAGKIIICTQQNSQQ